MGMWVDERGRKVSESFQNFKIGQIEGWRILHKYSNQGKCSESGILEPEKTSFGLSPSFCPVLAQEKNRALVPEKPEASQLTHLQCCWI